jgi:hypothetical protein
MLFFTLSFKLSYNLTEVEAKSEEQQASEKKMFISRKYNNSEDYMVALVNYVRSYCCKGEEFPVDAVKELKKIVNSDINGETSFGSIAHRLNQKLLTQKNIRSPTSKDH